MTSNKCAKIECSSGGDLNTLGYLVVPCPDVMDGFCFDAYVGGFREFIDPKGQVGIGSYGGLGNPSSVHSDMIRTLRGKLVRIQQEVLRGVYGLDWFYQSMLERVSCRYPGTKVTLDPWHRDCTVDYSDGINDQVKVFGGWFNMDTRPQYFSCVPGSQNEPDPSGGFNKLRKEDAAIYKARAACIEVPPGHMLMMHELIVHRIWPSKVPADGPSSWRLYLKCKLSRNCVSAYPMHDVLETIRTQGVPRLNHKQLFFPSYAQLHMACHQEKLMDFSNNVKPLFRTEEGRGFVKRKMTSLLDAGEELFAAYTADEITQLTPTKL